MSKDKSVAHYQPPKGKMLAYIGHHGNVIAIFKVAPNDEQGHAMAAALNCFNAKGEKR